MRITRFIAALAMTVYLSTACTVLSTDFSNKNALSGTEWTLVSSGKADAEKPVTTGTHITLIFDASGQASGHSGCNSYSGKVIVGSGFALRPSEIAFSDMSSTMMACAEVDKMELEQHYLTALQAATFYKLTGDPNVTHSRYLTLIVNDGTRLTFVQGTSGGV